MTFVPSDTLSQVECMSPLDCPYCSAYPDPELRCALHAMLPFWLDVSGRGWTWAGEPVVAVTRGSEAFLRACGVQFDSDRPAA